MSIFDRARKLQLFAMVAALTSAFVPALAQAPDSGSDAVSKGADAEKQAATLPTPEQIGDSLMAHQHYQAAIEAYGKAPQDAAAWNKMGIAYQMMFNMTDAMRCYQRSLELSPKNSNVLNNLGAAYDAQKNYRAAEKMYRKALKIDPRSGLILKNLGTNLLAQHKYKKGWETYKAALTVDPTIFGSSSRPRVENPASLQDRGAMNYYMAKGCVKAGLPDRAIEYLRMAINEGFTNPRKIIADREFASLHEVPAFQQMIATEKAQ